MVLITGFLLIGFFFSPFVSCGSETFTGASAFQESLSMQEQMLDEGYVVGILFILFPIAGVVGIWMGSVALKRIAQNETVRGQGNFALVMALLTAWPIVKVFQIMNDSEGIWKAEWGFYGSVLAVIGMVLGAAGMRNPPLQTDNKTTSPIPCLNQPSATHTKW
ncbi:hypothetical protein [Candidatus Oscillochloris fontis]|uniref:hypothetical protein n=1 Tax=Candidatus Oscillochloris fontis TaxID=2496868 RepID=UPI00101C5312|nr:hypothetical protein [Candidatus Oscillochloris fontis]